MGTLTGLGEYAAEGTTSMNQESKIRFDTLDEFPRKPKVLIVDDLPENVTLLNNFLLPLGYETDAAYSGQEALDRVQENPPDVILLDIVMPSMDGFEVCMKLKADSDSRHIPIIIVTGMAEREANIRAIEAGANDFLPKPFDSVLLNARIRSSVRSKFLHDRILDYQSQLETQNQTLENQVLDRTAQLARTQRVTVFSLAKLAESRDTETGHHLDRMRCYAREVAIELLDTGIYPDDLDQDLPAKIYDSSPLHDIGKVGIPDSILLKPGKLTKEEFEIMKTHSVIGGDTLKAADIEAGTNSFLAMGRDIAYSHHEKWDGSGYPDGLKAMEIPLPSRIVAISDVYDALSSKRPYKEPFSHEKSVEIILEGRGSHFDVEVVDAFMRREKQIIRIRESFQDAGELSRIQMLANKAAALQTNAS